MLWARGHGCNFPPPPLSFFLSSSTISAPLLILRCATSWLFLGGVVQVGNEFSSVEALWSQFENVMGRDGEGDRLDDEAAEEGREEKDRQQDVNDRNQVGSDNPAAVHNDAEGRS